MTPAAPVTACNGQHIAPRSRSKALSPPGWHFHPFLPRKALRMAHRAAHGAIVTVLARFWPILSHFWEFPERGCDSIHHLIGSRARAHACVRGLKMRRLAKTPQVWLMRFYARSLTQYRFLYHPYNTLIYLEHQLTLDPHSISHFPVRSRGLKIHSTRHPQDFDRH